MFDDQHAGALEDCSTLMLDMDGTLLDLAFDTDVWLNQVPAAYAAAHAVDLDDARHDIYTVYRQLQGTLDWYCLDHWSARLGLDVLALHHTHRAGIEYLPGAQAFLQQVAASERRVLLVTNSHRDTLALKAEQTGLTQYFHEIYSSHDLGYAKEEQGFWQALAAAEDFDPATSVFVDDNAQVLASAETFGLGRLLQITRPDTTRPVNPTPQYRPLLGVAELEGR